MFGHAKKIPKILIVEDQEVNHDLYRKVFEMAGFEVSTLKKIDDNFLDKVSNILPDIIAMDLMFEDDVTQNPFAGFELLSLLKEDKRTLQIPVFIFTAFSEEGKAIKAKELGASDFINVNGHKAQHLPDMFLKYVNNPKQYTPLHPIFRS